MESESQKDSNRNGTGERRPKLSANTGRELQRLAYWVAKNTPLRFHLVNGEEIRGCLVWWDLYSLRVELPDGPRIIMPKHSILYFGEAIGLDKAAPQSTS